MKARVIRETNFGDYSKDEKGYPTFGWKISFEAGSEWELEVRGDMFTPLAYCRNQFALVVLPVDRASDIFGDKVRQLAGFKVEKAE